MSVYDIITDRIVAMLEKGTAPWHKPWYSTATGEGPMNLTTKKPYHGLNVMLLGCLNYERPYFLTYKQAAANGGQVRKGEKGYPVIFWKIEEETELKEKSFLLRYYTVFNVSQCDGLSHLLPVAIEKPLEGPEAHAKAESIADGYQNGPSVKYGSNRACYQPLTDRVSMPHRADFVGQAEFYSTLFHELGHSTGHKNRLNRPTLADACMFGDTNYSKEELVAEFTAAFLCGAAGIENVAALNNSAAYIQGWSRELKKDATLIVKAASQATKAADLILGVK